MLEVVDAEPVEALEIVRAVVAERGEDHRFTPQELVRVGDVARASAELAAQRRHEERHVEDVQLVGQDLVGEPAREDGDRVEGERTADEAGHGGVAFMKGM